MGPTMGSLLVSLNASTICVYCMLTVLFGVSYPFAQLQNWDAGPSPYLLMLPLLSPEGNPARKTVWTQPYRDAYFGLWLVSMLHPLYVIPDGGTAADAEFYGACGMDFFIAHVRRPPPLLCCDVDRRRWPC
eukprot:TRINITY_DN5101_c0_g2_i7.p2 TRINITY_DN5101_c0_g2~~TRINITY_DN5101_c0_g2_i7.p2  ORF type:complete len:131 (-),score=33.01 TRINITY_DN5101_c0_g2_i7:217-609(-)